MTRNGNDLHQRRQEIDLLDAELLRLLNQRARVACELASIKKSSGLPVTTAGANSRSWSGSATRTPAR